MSVSTCSTPSRSRPIIRSLARIMSRCRPMPVSARWRPRRPCCGGRSTLCAESWGCRRWRKQPADAINACVTRRCRTLMERYLDISLRVNGEDVRERVEARKTLVDFLRDDLGLTGSHIGCEQGVCGACTVLIDGAVVRGCLLLAVQCDGAEVETIEGISDSGAIADLQDAFARRNALQCGFCTPGMLIGASDLLGRGGVPSRAAIREHISGNYCRCTGYQAIVDAIESTAQSRADGREQMKAGKAG